MRYISNIIARIIILVLRIIRIPFNAMTFIGEMGVDILEFFEEELRDAFYWVWIDEFREKFDNATLAEKERLLAKMESHDSGYRTKRYTNL